MFVAQSSTNTHSLTRKWPRTAAIGYHISASRSLDCILDNFLGITKLLLEFSRTLFAETFDLLLFAADQLSSLFLHFTGGVFYRPFDLIFVHDRIPSSNLTGSLSSILSLNVTLPPVCTVTNPQNNQINFAGQHN